MAAGYAQHRPPVHERVFELLEVRTGRLQVGRALDLGCGAGLSTRVLQARASEVIGLDPSPSMACWAKKFVPGAEFVVGVAEAIPLGNETVEFVTAAGSLNYADPGNFFRETARVLKKEGRLLVYDFEPGRSFRDAPGLDAFFEEFTARYPWPAGDALEIRPETLGTLSDDFELDWQQRFQIPLAMTLDEYVNYMMTETNVAAAIRRGEVRQDIREWCNRTLLTLWNEDAKEVLFHGYLARLGRKLRARQ
jgi:ubiquinone/menaquinone biosynthesis C-methylase UbiE